MDDLALDASRTTAHCQGMDTNRAWLEIRLGISSRFVIGPDNLRVWAAEPQEAGAGSVPRQAPTDLLSLYDRDNKLSGPLEESPISRRISKLFAACCLQRFTCEGSRSTGRTSPTRLIPRRRLGAMRS
jgi:hypothetical protein